VFDRDQEVLYARDYTVHVKEMCARLPPDPGKGKGGKSSKGVAEKVVVSG